LREELGIDTSTGCLWPLSFASHAYEDFHLLMPLFACRVWSGTPKPKEGQKLIWINPKEISAYDLVPADYVFVEALRTL
jgi:8-oxo-dGTP diphosphatase